MSLKNKILDRMMKVQYITYVSPSKATGTVADVYRKANSEFGFAADPIVLHSHIPELLELFYDTGREVLLVSDKVPRLAKESMVATISTANQCPYCVDAHSIIVNSIDDKSATDAIESGNIDSIKDERLRALVYWASRNRDPAADIIQQPPFSSEEAPEVIGTVIYFHYINRMVNVFVKDSQVPSGIMRGMFKQLGKKMMEPFSTQYIPRGETIEGNGRLPAELHWTVGNPPIAQRFMKFNTFIQELGRQYLPDDVRALLQQKLQSWEGEQMPMDHAWIHNLTRHLKAEHIPPAKTVLLTALASYRVNEKVISGFRQFDPADEAVLSSASWAAWMASMRIATWLAAPFKNPKQPAASQPGT